MSRICFSEYVLSFKDKLVPSSAFRLSYALNVCWTFCIRFNWSPFHVFSTFQNSLCLNNELFVFF